MGKTETIINCTQEILIVQNKVAFTKILTANSFEDILLMQFYNYKLAYAFSCMFSIFEMSKLTSKNDGQYSDTKIFC